MKAYKFEIGSDDDDFTVEIVRSLPVVELDLKGHYPCPPDDEFYAEMLKTFDIYFPMEDEIAYFVEKGAQS